MSKENDPLLNIVNNACSKVDPFTANSVEGEEEVIDQLIEATDVDLANSSCKAHCLKTFRQRVDIDPDVLQ